MFHVLTVVRDLFRAVQLRPRRIMLFCSLQHIVVRCRLVFVIVRLAIIFAHRIILELVPHQNAPQIRMAVEANAVEIENLALLKFRAAPDRRERRQTRPSARSAVRIRMITGPCFMRHRVKMINRFEITGDLSSLVSSTSFSSPSTSFFTFTFLDRRDRANRRRSHWSNNRVAALDHRARNAPPRAHVRCRSAATTAAPEPGFGTIVDLRAGHGRFGARFDLFERFHR